MRTRLFPVGAAVVAGLGSFGEAAAASPSPSVSGAGIITLPPEYGDVAGDQVLFQLQAQGGQAPSGTFNVVHVDDAGGLYAHAVGDITRKSVLDPLDRFADLVGRPRLAPQQPSRVLVGVRVLPPVGKRLQVPGAQGDQRFPLPVGEAHRGSAQRARGQRALTEAPISVPGPSAPPVRRRMWTDHHIPPAGGRGTPPSSVPERVVGIWAWRSVGSRRTTA